MSNQGNLFVTLFALALSLGTAVFTTATTPQDTASVYAKHRLVDGVKIQATAAVDDEYLDIAALVYEHMTSRTEPYDLRALHSASGFRILLITRDERFIDLPEFAGEDEELEQADGLGGAIGEFFIALRVGSPHTLVHELGHGIYHSAIQFEETGGALDEEDWYHERVRTVYDMDLEQAMEAHGEEVIHEVLLAPENTFSAGLAAAWRNADENQLWQDEYGGTEPNEYWAEGVALWFRASDLGDGDSREYLLKRDPMLHALCASIFPATDWTPGQAHVASGGMVRFENDEDEASDSELAQFLQFLDRNADGRIDSYEGAEAMLHLTQLADANADQAFDYDELRDFLASEREGEREERLQIFEEFDLNSDGALSESELPEEVRAFFEPIDVDGDGQVAVDELLAAEDLGDPTLMFEQELLSFLEEADHDNDGAFALDDLPVFMRSDFEEEFKRLDVDANGLVTKQELFALVEAELSGATFEVAGDSAFMNGVIGPTTPGRVLQLVLEHPSVTTIVMLDVPGSMDDDSNLRAARYVRKHGLATFIPSNGEIASGGTDFFLAGVRRSAEKGALFGVHSWGGFGEEGADLPRDDPEHEKYLDFYSEMNIPADFYWYTLEAASADDIHWMTDEEIELYDVLTSPLRAADESSEG